MSAVSVPAGAYVFALVSAVFWGLAPIAMKQGLEHDGSTMLAAAMQAIVSLTVYTLLLSVLYGVGESYTGIPMWALATFVFAGVIGNGIGRLVLYTGISRVGASITAAVSNTRPLIASVFAIALLGESVTPWLAAGIVLITAGIVAISLSDGGDVRGWRNFDLAFPFAAAVAYAAGNVIRRYGFVVTELEPLSAILLNEVGAFTVVLSYGLTRYGTEFLDAPRLTYGYFALGGLFGAGGLLSLFVALSLGPVVIVDPLSGVAPLITILFAYFLLRSIEDVTRGVVAGAVFVVIGAAFITAF